MKLNPIYNCPRCKGQDIVQLVDAGAYGIMCRDCGKTVMSNHWDRHDPCNQVKKAVVRWNGGKDEALS